MSPGALDLDKRSTLCRVRHVKEPRDPTDTTQRAGQWPPPGDQSDESREEGV